MPPLTFDSILRARDGGEPEDACEAEFSGSDDDDDSGAGSDECGGGDDVDGDDYDPYSPAESLWLRIGEDIDWSEVGAVLKREDSTKGASNPKSHSSCVAAPAARMSSSCAAGGGTTSTTKAVGVVVIAGLPAAAGKISREHGRRRRLGRARVFAGEAVEIAEPGSPKVSCLGGVRSRAQQRQQQPYRPAGAAGRRRWCAWLVGVACRLCWRAPRV